LGWLVLGSRPAVENGAWSDSKEVCTARSRNVLHASDDRDLTETEVRAYEGLDRGRSAQGVGVAVAGVDEVGELIECATYPQNLEKA